MIVNYLGSGFKLDLNYFFLLYYEILLLLLLIILNVFFNCFLLIISLDFVTLSTPS